jgi:hypothetical protein
MPGLPILAHLLRQMPSRIGGDSGTTSFLYLRQPQQSLNLVKIDKRTLFTVGY